MTASGVSAGRLSVARAIDELDLSALGRALWRRKARIIGLTLVAAGLAFTAVNMVTPRYKSEARVLIETRDNIFLRPDAEKLAERGATVDQEAVTSQVQLMLSRDLARVVIRTLKLGERPEFDPVLRGTSVVRIMLEHLGLVRDPLSQTPEERVLRSYAERLTAYQVEKSRVIAIEFDSEDPDLAAQAANTVTETYLVLQQSAKQEQSRTASQWLAERIDALRKSVSEAEAKAEQYRARTNLFVGTNNTTLSNQQLGEFNAQLGAARAQKADAEAKARFIREALRSGAPVEFTDIVNSELMRRLSEQRVTLRAQLAEQSSTLLDQHPRIKELKAQIGDLERQVRGEADRLARSLENDARLAAAKVEQLSAGMDQLKRQAANTNEQDVELRALEREAKAQRDLLESYLAKYREAASRDSIGAGSPEARIISTAIVSNTPSWPKKVPTILLAALATFAVSVGFVLSGELLRGASIARADASPQEPAAAAAPMVPAAAVGRRHGPGADAHAGTTIPLAAIEQLARELGAAGESGRRVVVMSLRRGLDAPLVAITLARVLGRQAKAVLVDLALDAPSLSVIAADPSAPGLSELVRDAASLGQIITRDRDSPVHVITAGRVAGDGAAVMGSEQLAVTVEALGRSYDHVVLNAGTFSGLTVDRFAQLAHQVVLVADAIDDPATRLVQARLAGAGFKGVSAIACAVQAPQSDASGTRAAA